MSERKRHADDYMTYTRPDEIQINEDACYGCKHRSSNPKVCEVFPEGKPQAIFWGKEECAKYEARGTFLAPYSREKKQSQVFGGIFGLAVADALGVPVEFQSRSQLAADPVVGLRGFGTYHQPAGTWSDDSSMTFCLVESLCEGYNLEDIGDKFLRWLQAAYWTPYNRVFDIGNATLKALQSLAAGARPEQAGGKSEYDNGNGSLMRILPLAYFLENEPDLQKRIAIVQQVSAITHGHIRSQIACAMYVEYAIRLLKGDDKETALSNMKQLIRSYYSNMEIAAKELHHFARILDQDIAAKQEAEIDSSGYVVHTLEAALWCFLNFNTYEEIVLKAINLGSDTDTTAAVVGGLAGIYYGAEGIVDHWVVNLARKDDIATLTERFYQAIYSC